MTKKSQKIKKNLVCPQKDFRHWCVIHTPPVEARLLRLSLCFVIQKDKPIRMLCGETVEKGQDKGGREAVYEGTLYFGSFSIKGDGSSLGQTSIC